MKYQILLDKKYILYDLRDKELYLENPELELTINKIGTLSFTIYPDHPYFDKLEKLISRIEVLKNGKIIFCGRIIEEEQGIYNSKRIVCESALAFLNDSIIEPQEFGGSPTEFFNYILGRHNAVVDENQKIYPGVVTVVDKNDYIGRHWENYENSWDVLSSRTVSSECGGYLIERFEDDKIYLDWLAEIEDTATQVIEFGENLMDIVVKNDASSTYTVIVPLGAEYDNEDGTKSRLTIESVNDGKDYLVNEEMRAIYGWIVAPVEETTWDNVTIADNLLTRATEFINNQAPTFKSSLEIKAIDLNATNADIETFYIYQNIRVISKIHNFDKNYILSSIKLPLAHPDGITITLGESFNTLTGIELGNKTNLDNITTRVDTIEKNYVVNDEVQNIVDTALLNNTSILQSAEEIIMNALQDYVTTSDFETFQETVSTQFIQTAEDFTFNFNNLVSQITTIEGETQQQFREISKYIRFVDGKIILGETGNELTLVQQNDRISFFQSNNEVAYFSNNKLTITDGDFLNSLKIGNFAFKPRANGNLSLVYVGGDTVG